MLECVFVGVGLTGGKVSTDIFKGHVGIAVSQYMYTAKTRWLTSDHVYHVVAIHTWVLMKHNHRHY